MIEITRKQLVAILAAAVLAGWLFQAPASPPSPQPADRPVLRWIARAAKNLLWIAIVAEGPPAETARQSVVHARVGDDGYQTVDHGRW